MIEAYLIEMILVGLAILVAAFVIIQKSILGDWGTVSFWLMLELMFFGLEYLIWNEIKK